LFACGWFSPVLEFDITTICEYKLQGFAVYFKARQDVVDTGCVCKFELNTIALMVFGQAIFQVAVQDTIDGCHALCGLWPGVAVSNDNIFLAGQAFQADRATYVKLVSADANFRTEAVFKAVCKLG